MKKILFLFITFALAGNASCQSNKSKPYFNLDLEKVSSSSSLPYQWFVWGIKDAYEISIDSIEKYEGKNSVHIKSIAEKKDFACIATVIPAKYKAQEIEVRAYMKISNVEDGYAGLLLRIDGRDGTLAFDNMQRKGVKGTSDWAQYTIKLPYPIDAKKIYIGALLTGKGELWVDNFEVLLDGKAISKVKFQEIKLNKANQDTEFDNGSKIDTINLANGKVEDLKNLGLIWGFMKYYHPNIAKGDYNWDYELFRFLPKYLIINKADKRDELLISWINSFGDFKISSKTYNIGEDTKLSPDLGWISNSGFSKGLVEVLKKVKIAKKSNNHFYINLNQGAKNPDFKNEITYKNMKSSDVGIRLLALYRYWNMVQYFYPYKNIIEEDWKDVLNEFIPKYINANNKLAYKLATLEIIGRIKDTHANIYSDRTIKKYWGYFSVAADITFIENKAVVTNIYEVAKEEKTKLQPGDIIISINGVSTDSIVKQRLKYSPASNYTTQLRGIADKLLHSSDSIIQLELIRDGISIKFEEKTYTSNRIKFSNKYNSKDTCFRKLSSDIAYIYPGNIKNEYWAQLSPEVMSTKGLIIDFRCYPSDGIIRTLGLLLMPDKRQFTDITKPSIEYPGLFEFTKKVNVGKNNKEYYKGKVIILINEITQSSAEYTTMALRQAPNAIVIGSQTAGADGNVSLIILPGGITTYISGIGIYNTDRSETQGIGIIPDIEIRPTIQGIKEGQDEVLEKAIELINAE